jgi:hypothetical protein
LRNAPTTYLANSYFELSQSGMTLEVAKNDGSETAKTVRLFSGCVYQDKGWLLTRVNGCDGHRRKLMAKAAVKAQS